jgi:ABC-type antimicrobial peptide transport system, permease component
MDIDALNRRLDEAPLVDTAFLKLDPQEESAFFGAAKETPVIAGVVMRRASVDLFHETIAEMLLVYTALYVLFACFLSVGVVYNNLRIALSERGRELATLRVLGFRTGEIGYMLLGEAALGVVVALPVGCLLGFGLAWLIAHEFASELFRVPLAIGPDTFGRSMLVTLVSVCLCGAALQQRLEHLDLVAVLKTRE